MVGSVSENLLDLGYSLLCNLTVENFSDLHCRDKYEKYMYFLITKKNPQSATPQAIYSLQVIIFGYIKKLFFSEVDFDNSLK